MRQTWISESRLKAKSSGRRPLKVAESNTTSKAAELAERAQDLVKQINPIHEPALAKDGLQIFLLGKSAKTNFRKDTSGGLFANHFYLWGSSNELNTDGAEFVAQALDGKFWAYAKTKVLFGVEKCAQLQNEFVRFSAKIVNRLAVHLS